MKSIGERRVVDDEEYAFGGAHRADIAAEEAAERGDALLEELISPLHRDDDNGEVYVRLDEEYIYAALGDLERTARFLAEMIDDDNAQGFAADMENLGRALREALGEASRR
jgi:hypothetical protein